jgi:hypothetical protein
LRHSQINLRDWPCDHNRGEAWQRLRINAHFLFARLPIRRAKTNTFSNRRGRLNEKQTEE